MKPIVLGFSGRIASGKSSVATIAANALGVAMVSFGDLCRDVAEYMGLNPRDRKVLQNIGNLLVEYPSQFCARVLKQANYQRGQSLVVDGIRHEVIVKELRDQVAPAQLVLIYIQTDESIIRNRLRDEISMTKLQGVSGKENEIQEMEQDDTEQEVLTTLPDLADFTIRNDGLRSPEDVFQGVLQWLDQQGLLVETSPRTLEENPAPVTRSVLDFEGIGKDNPIGVDAQEYVNQMRAEWDEREQSWRQ